MVPKLSIIIPCYNCASTLEEAVDSCFSQELHADDFEIIMVDDGSTDKTKNVMSELAKKYSNIALLHHEHNKGGGAARNTGIRAARGEFIFCLDSDNFFAPQTLSKLLATQKEKNCDGVAVWERRFFVGTDANVYRTHRNTIFDRSITIHDIFNAAGQGTLLDNFLFKRTAFEKAGGYPEHHGFDTQCFELRFLAAGLTVYVAPGVSFYHRQSKDGTSYFDREYIAGNFSRNFYLICEDILHLLSPSVRSLILNFNFFAEAKLDTNNLKAVLDQYTRQHPGSFLVADHQKYQGSLGKEMFLNQNETATDKTTLFTCSILAYHLGNLQLSRKFLNQLNFLEGSVPLWYHAIRLTLTESGASQRISDSETLRVLHMLQSQKQTPITRSGLIGILYKIRHALHF